jgi:hypothetical protein
MSPTNISISYWVTYLEKNGIIESRKETHKRLILDMVEKKKGRMKVDNVKIYAT